jgi:hypothetical protein
MNLIEKLGLEKCKQIVEGAPEGSGIYILADERDCTYFSKTSEHFDDGAAIWEVNGWTGVDDGYPHNGRLDHQPYILIDNLRAALADHDRTDYVTDIRNHIAPTTKVIER